MATMTQSFLMSLLDLQPSQLYISSEKLAAVQRTVDFSVSEAMAPLPVRPLGDRVVLTDGRTRGLAAFLAGLTCVPVSWDTDELDWEAYRICVDWCTEEGIKSVADLRDRVVGPDAHEELWGRRCREMHRRLAEERRP